MSGWCAGDEAIEVLPQLRLDERRVEPYTFVSLLVKMQVEEAIAVLLNLLLEEKLMLLLLVVISDSEFMIC